MDKILEIRFSGWTATPRLPFILSGNALCMSVPSYSTVLGIIGCCLGRNVSPKEVKVGYKYNNDDTATDIETRRRLQVKDKKTIPHEKGSDAYQREFHTNPTLTVWIDRIDWMEYFENPVGTPALGRSQDLLRIDSVEIKTIEKTEKATLSGCMIPFAFDKIVPGQLIQIAEAFEENEEIGTGRTSIRSTMFTVLHPDKDNLVEVSMDSLFRTTENNHSEFYLHSFYE